MDAYALLIGFLVGAVTFWVTRTVRLGRFHQQALLIVQQAERATEQRKAEAQLACQQLSQKHELDMQKERFELDRRQQELANQKDRLNGEKESLKKELSSLKALQVSLQAKESAISLMHQEALASIERVTGISLETAQEEIRKQAESEMHHWIEQRKTELLALADKEVMQQSQELLLASVERLSDSFSKDRCLEEVPLQDRAQISKIIGKGGRNIHTFESLLKVNVIIEEDPPKIFLSSHDPALRIAAKATLQRILQGKITPVTIQQAYEQESTATTIGLQQRGKEACKECGIPHSHSSDVLTTLGTLSCRSSRGQNVLAHSVEVAKLMGMLAGEFQLSPETAKTIGLFHDIGKGLSASWGESHAIAGSAFLKSHGFSEEIVQAVASHHGDKPRRSVFTRLLVVCDRISAKLPGNRREQEPEFLEVVRRYEQKLSEVSGVAHVWAHHAEHHLELIVHTKSDEDSAQILQAIERTLQTLPVKAPVHVFLPASGTSSWYTSQDRALRQ